MGETTIKEIATRSSNLVTARTDESIDSCMHKMLSKDIRHLPMVDKNGKVVGMISIKDLVRLFSLRRRRLFRVCLILHLERVLTTGQSRFFTFFGVKCTFFKLLNFYFTAFSTLVL